MKGLRYMTKLPKGSCSEFLLQSSTVLERNKLLKVLFSSTVRNDSVSLLFAGAASIFA